MFEWTISIGTVLTLVTIVFAGASFYWKQENDSRVFKEDIFEIKVDLKQLHEVLLKLALQTERLDAQAKRLDHFAEDLKELRHGKGFIT